MKVFLSAAFLLFASPTLFAQNATGGRAVAPDDFTGYWVSIVTENWRYRMLVPDKNDYPKVPINPEGRKIADSWDPAKDQASGNACKGYGAAALLQIPGRLHIYWQDDNTLRLDTDSGTQTRLFHFGGSPSPNEAPSWQGYSVALWGGDEPRDRRDTQGAPVQDKTGALLITKEQRKQAAYMKVVTNHMQKVGSGGEGNHYPWKVYVNQRTGERIVPETSADGVPDTMAPRPRETTT
jgi:hypothetical protein